MEQYGIAIFSPFEKRNPLGILPGLQTTVLVAKVWNRRGGKKKEMKEFQQRWSLVTCDKTAANTLTYGMLVISQ